MGVAKLSENSSRCFEAAVRSDRLINGSAPIDNITSSSAHSTVVEAIMST